MPWSNCKTSGDVAGNAAHHRALVIATVTQMGILAGYRPHVRGPRGLPRATYYGRR